jgi:hypothetical protein
MADAAERSTAPRRGGRRWASILLMLLLIAAGAAAGYFSTRPLYRATALIALREFPPSDNPFDPGLPTAMASVDRLEEQVAAMRSPRVIDAALSNPDVRHLVPPSPFDADLFSKRLSVRRRPGSMIEVRFTDPDPRTAGAFVKAVVAAYRMIFVEADAALEARHLDVLTNQETALSSDVRNLTGEIQSRANEFGTADLEYVWKGQFARVSRLAQELEDRKLTQGSATRPADLTSGALALIQQRYAAEESKLRQIGMAKMGIDQARAKLDPISHDLRIFRERIKFLNLRGMSGERIRIISDGSATPGPAIDGRPRRAAWGALIGIGVFTAARFVLRWRRRRVPQSVTAVSSV